MMKLDFGAFFQKTWLQFDKGYDAFVLTCSHKVEHKRYRCIIIHTWTAVNFNNSFESSERKMWKKDDIGKRLPTNKHLKSFGVVFLVDSKRVKITILICFARVF